MKPIYPSPCHGHWVPHISLVFREMWDTTNFDLRFIGLASGFAVSHISRKTSEKWGTVGSRYKCNISL
jgi:hypothetical protein